MRASFEEVRSLRENRVEVDARVGLRCLGEARAGQAQRERVVGQHGDARGVVADKPGKAPPQLVRRGPVEGENEDAVGRRARDAQQVRDAVRDHARLPRTGAGEDEAVRVVAGGHQMLLHRMAQILDDAPIRLGGGRAFQHVLAVGEEQADELASRQREVRRDEPQRVGELAHRPPREFGDDVNLEIALVIMLFERSEVRLGEAAARRFGQHADRHCGAEHGTAAVEHQRAHAVEIEQCALARRRLVADHAEQADVGAQRRAKLAHLRFDQEIGARDCRRQPAEQMVEQTLRGGDPRFGVLGKLPPRARHPRAVLVTRALAHLEASPLCTRVAERLPEHAQQAQQLVGQHVEPGVVAHALAQRA